MGVERFNIKRLLSEEDIAILTLLDEALLPFANRPGVYLIGDNRSWLEEVGYAFDVHRRDDGLKEIQIRLDRKLQKLLQVADDDKRPTIRKMRLAIVRSNDVLIKLALLVGLKPSEGLYDEFSKIVSVFGNDLGKN